MKNENIIVFVDYESINTIGITNLNNRGDGIDRHPMSLRLIKFLKKCDCNDCFYWNSSGDRIGETLMYHLCAFLGITVKTFNNIGDLNYELLHRIF